MDTLSLEPIGMVVDSPWQEPRQAPRQGPARGAESVIEIDPAWAPALEGLEPGRDLWVLGYFHCARQAQIRVRPRGDPRRPLTGLFNTRTPHRPCPVSLTLVRLLERRGGRLRVRGLELVSGTPILDIKPYVPGIDRPRKENS